MKDILLFDLDGTLTDPRVGITRSVAFALEKAGIHVENTDDLCLLIGPSLKDPLRKQSIRLDVGMD